MGDSAIDGPADDIGRNAGEDGGEDGQRRDERDSLLVLAKLIRDGGAVETVRVRNVSSGGLMAQTGEAYPVGTHLVIELEGLGRIGATVAWAESGRIGIAFDHPIEKTLARKAKARTDSELFRPSTVFKRPPIKSF